jgi:hypothetical protein
MDGGEFPEIYLAVEVVVEVEFPEVYLAVAQV